MTPLLRAALQFQQFCDARGWRSCVIGGVAVLRWGEPRFTQDVDLSLLTGFGSEDEFSSEILQAYRPRIREAGEFARRNRVLLLDTELEVPLDVGYAALPYEAELIERASFFEFAPDCLLRTCSAEDLIITKLFASRERDLLDVQGVAIRQKGKLDWDYIERQLRPLAELKEAPEILAAMERLRRY